MRSKINDLIVKARIRIRNQMSIGSAQIVYFIRNSVRGIPLPIGPASVVPHHLLSLAHGKPEENILQYLLFISICSHDREKDACAVHNGIEQICVVSLFLVLYHSYTRILRIPSMW